MKKFKNSFGVKSDSVALLQAFIEEAKVIGWNYQSSSADLEKHKKLYFRGFDGEKTATGNLAEGHYWICQGFGGGTPYDLSSQWDDAVKALKETQKKYLTKLEEYKEGDYVTITKRTDNTWSSGAGGRCPNGRVSIPFTGKVIKFVKEVGEPFNSININNYGFCTDSITIRKATPDEIKSAHIIEVVKFGKHSGIVTSEGIVSIDDYVFTIQDVQKVVEYFTNTGIMIKNYWLNVDSAKISFGCKSGTLKEAKEILRVYNKIKK